MSSVVLTAVLAVFDPNSESIHVNGPKRWIETMLTKGKQSYDKMSTSLSLPDWIAGEKG